MIFVSLLIFFKQAEPAPRGSGSFLTALFPFILVFLIFYLLIIMPSRKKQKKHQMMVEQLKPGDKTIVFFCGTGGRAGEAYDIMQMFKPEVKTYFLNAELTFHKDGGYTLKELD